LAGHQYRQCRARFRRPLAEPLAALDLKRKLEILPCLERLHRELPLPI
jgi:ABC-type molybdate transport system ATPase subunit